MFGFSLPKLLVLIAILLAVWYGFKFIGRLDKERKARVRDARRSRSPAGAGSEPESMIRCPVCEVYVAADDAGSCGRADCPY